LEFEVLSSDRKSYMVRIGGVLGLEGAECGEGALSVCRGDEEVVVEVAGDDVGADAVGGEAGGEGSGESDCGERGVDAEENPAEREIDGEIVGSCDGDGEDDGEALGLVEEGEGREGEDVACEGTGEGAEDELARLKLRVERGEDGGEAGESAHGWTRSAGVFGEEWFCFDAAVALLDEELDLALGGVKLLLAGGGEPYALFEELEGVFEGEVALFELGDDGFEFLEGVFEVWHGDFRACLRWPGWMVWGGRRR
jgi:hypothetical protein